MIQLYFENVNGYHACPDVVKIPELGYNFDHNENDAITFIVGIDESGNIRLIYSETLVHTRLILMSNRKIGRLSNRIEGRIWTNKKIIAIWSDVASSDMEIIEELFKEIANIDISNYIFVSEFDNKRIFAIDLQQFEKLNISNNWNENDWQKLVSAKKKNEMINNQPKIANKNKLGFSDKDYMRHYLYFEGKE